jgi:hypothetical protein
MVDMEASDDCASGMDVDERGLKSPNGTLSLLAGEIEEH